MKTQIKMMMPLMMISMLTLSSYAAVDGGLFKASTELSNTPKLNSDNIKMKTDKSVKDDNKKNTTLSKTEFNTKLKPEITKEKFQPANIKVDNGFSKKDAANKTEKFTAIDTSKVKTRCIKG